MRHWGCRSAQLAAHTGILNVFGFLTCGMYGLCDAGASTVGLLLGAGEAELAKSAGKKLIALMAAMAMAVAALLVAGRSVIGHIFSHDSQVLHYATELSSILAAAYLLLALCFGSLGVLQGQGRPHIAAISMFVGLWGISVPMAYVFGFVWPNNGLVGVWYGLICGYGTRH